MGCQPRPLATSRGRNQPKPPRPRPLGPPARPLDIAGWEKRGFVRTTAPSDLRRPFCLGQANFRSRRSGVGSPVGQVNDSDPATLLGKEGNRPSRSRSQLHHPDGHQRRLHQGRFRGFLLRQAEGQAVVDTHHSEYLRNNFALELLASTVGSSHRLPCCSEVEQR